MSVPLPIVLVRPVGEDDGFALMAMNLANVGFHRPWVWAPITPLDLRQYLDKQSVGSSRGYTVRLPNGDLVGIVNLNNIVHGALMGASLGYYGSAAHAGFGLMRAGVAAVLDQAFGPLGLHRLEANIQPANKASRRLVQALGFRLEGFSPRYLKIGDEWRDHERWAILAEEWGGSRPANKR